MTITYVQQCTCGAITIRYDNNASNSMFQETFEKLKLDISQAHVLQSHIVVIIVLTIGALIYVSVVLENAWDNVTVVQTNLMIYWVKNLIR